MAVPNLKLQSGHDIPVLGFGTYFGLPEDYKADDVRRCVESAIDVGYRHIDTALLYQTEGIVGEAVKNKIKDGTVKREDLFITTKLPFNNHLPDHARQALATSLKNLDLGYIDLYLIHTPFASKKGDDGEHPNPASSGAIEMQQANDHVATWKVLEEAVERGVVRSIGVSNFNKRQLENLLANGRIKPAMNQVEVQPYFANAELIDFCQQNNIAITAYTPLGQPHSSWSPKDWVSPLQHPTINQIAVKHGKSPAQVAMKFQLQRGLVVVAKATSAKRQQENFQLFDFTLTSQEMQQMHQLNKNDRINKFDAFKSHKDYPFNDPY